MKASPVFQNQDHRWWILHDPSERQVIDANVYVMESGENAIVFDPGGFETFPQVFAALSGVVSPDHVHAAFASHQDPDIASSLPLWNACNNRMVWHVPKLWEGFIRHFGALSATLQGIPDAGGEVTVGSLRLQWIPAHYLHSSANFHAYDPAAKVYFSGDVGAALLPAGHAPFVEDGDAAFRAHIEHARYFHERWMPSNEAKRNWIARVSQLDIEYLCPQHGAIYRGDNVKRFLQWFDGLSVGKIA